MPKKNLPFLIIVVCLMFIAIIWYFSQPSSVVNDAAITTTQTQILAAQSDTTTTASMMPPTLLKPPTSSFVTGLEQLPKSLQDIEVDGRLEVDANGNLKITEDVRHVFDFFFAATGEESNQTIMARIRAYLHHQLPEKAATQAEALLNAYVAYRDDIEALPKVANPMQNIAAVKTQKQAIQSIRSKYFDRVTSEAFFGAEDTYDNYTMARLEIMQNKTLTPEQKAQQQAMLIESLPNDLQDDIKTLNVYQNLTDLTKEWQKNQGSPQQLRTIREQTVGVEAANRLEKLDQETTTWNRRINSYLTQRDTVLSNSALAEPDQQQMVNQLKQQQFNPQERVRVEAFESMHDQQIALPQ